MSENSASTEKKRHNQEYLKPFPPGVSGNPAGRPKGSRNIKSIMRDLVDLPREVFDKEGGEKYEVTRLEFICAKLVKMAEEGDMASIDRVFDRLEGKPEQKNKNENSGPDGQPIEVAIKGVASLSDEQLAQIAAIAKGE